VTSSTKVEEDDPDVQAIRAEFDQRCQRAGVKGVLIVGEGEVVEQTCLRAGVTDLVIVNMSHPPALQPLSRLNSGFRDLIQRCPRPVLATPQTVSPLNQALIAYDDSPKAREALYTGAYLAARWRIPLSVLTVDDSRADAETIQAYARTYLSEHRIEAKFQIESGPATETILKIAEKEGCDLLMIGGYGRGPLLEFVLGSTVNALLNDTSIPILICR
jgi:nucleotide-binding universal stress UspA family protein